MNGNQGRHGIRKRAPKACTRCHEQKIKCNGLHPCDQCSRRSHVCQFKDLRDRISVVQNYTNTRESRPPSLQLSSEQTEQGIDSSSAQSEPGPIEMRQDDRPQHGHENNGGSYDMPLASQSMAAHPQTAPEVSLINPLAKTSMNYVFDGKNRPVFMGSCSSWAFGRRVLSMTHERLLGRPLASEALHWPDNVYELGWDGTRNEVPQASFDVTTLPSPDFSLFLINAVKFRCGQLFYLFEEQPFMEQVSRFHENDSVAAQPPLLWYIHYLLISAFGKAFATQGSKTQKPPGADLFVQAMKLLPNITFFDADPVEMVQVLCCTALYLQSLDFRCSAYRFIGEAVRVAITHGMHTNTYGSVVDSATAQGYCKVWWTAYILDHWIASFMGLPVGISDAAISAPLPVQTSRRHQGSITELQIELSRIQAQIVNTIYGAEGRLNRQFLGAIKTTLSNIANVTDQLNDLYPVARSDAASGISRVSAHLHLLHHQCIVTATRPLLYSFLQSMLGQSAAALLRRIQSSGIKPLLRTCTDSAQKMLMILSKLQEQGLLESFLPFDLEAAFTASIALLMASALDGTLLQDYLVWSHHAFAILDEMTRRGSRMSEMLSIELQQLEGLLHQLPAISDEQTPQFSTPTSQNNFQQQDGDRSHGSMPYVQSSHLPHSLPNYLSAEEFNWQDEITTAQLIDIANAVDLNNFEWLSASSLDFPQ